MKTKFPVPVLVIIGIISAATLLYAYNVHFPHYSDSKMEAHFLDNEADFSRLVEMFDEDSEVDMIIDGKVYASEKTVEAMSEERFEQYKTLLDKTEVGHGIKRIRDGKAQEIIFISTSYSSEPDEYNRYHTSSKGFSYSPAKPLENDGHVKFKKIKENWYLYYIEGISKLE